MPAALRWALTGGLSLNMFLWWWKETEAPRGHPYKHGENMQTTQKGTGSANIQTQIPLVVGH